MFIECDNIKVQIRSFTAFHLKGNVFRTYIIMGGEIIKLAQLQVKSLVCSPVSNYACMEVILS